MNKENNLALVSDLIVLARADDKVTLTEYDFIMRLAFRMDLEKNDVDQLFKNPLPTKNKFSELERITHFHKLVLLMNVDRETHDKEIIAIKNFGLKMGIREGLINQVLVEMEKHEDKVIPSEELIKIFKTFYN
jgi:hypothetical protein